MIVIIKRELIDNFKSLRFCVLILFSIVLFTLNGFVFVQRIEKQVNSYTEKSVKGTTRSTYLINLYKKPSHLQFIAEGGDKYQPEGYTLYPEGWIEPSHISSVNINYKIPDIPELDWVFIIKIIFSLYALLLGYNAVSGEKEWGTKHWL